MSILPVTPAKPYHSRGFASIVVGMAIKRIENVLDLSKWTPPPGDGFKLIQRWPADSIELKFVPTDAPVPDGWIPTQDMR
jgi:hypothetical protein